MDDGSRKAEVGNIELPVRDYLAFDSVYKTAVCVGLGVEIPAASRWAGERELGVEPLLVMYKKFGPLHVNASFSGDVGLFSLDDEERAGLGAQGAPEEEGDR